MFATPWKPPLRVALFGTSADPPHLGHQSILLWLAQEFDQVAVWAADNPYKAKQSPICDRAEMLRLLIETLPTERTGPLGKVRVNQRLHQLPHPRPQNLAQGPLSLCCGC